MDFEFFPFLCILCCYRATLPLAHSLRTVCVYIQCTVLDRDVVGAHSGTYYFLRCKPFDWRNKWNTQIHELEIVNGIKFHSIHCFSVSYVARMLCAQFVIHHANFHFGYIFCVRFVSIPQFHYNFTYSLSVRVFIKRLNCWRNFFSVLLFFRCIDDFIYKFYFILIGTNWRTPIHGRFSFAILFCLINSLFAWLVRLMVYGFHAQCDCFWK